MLWSSNIPAPFRCRQQLFFHLLFRLFYSLFHDFNEVHWYQKSVCSLELGRSSRTGPFFNWDGESLWWALNCFFFHSSLLSLQRSVNRNLSTSNFRTKETNILFTFLEFYFFTQWPFASLKTSLEITLKQGAASLIQDCWTTFKSCQRELIEQVWREPTEPATVNWVLTKLRRV